MHECTASFVSLPSFICEKEQIWKKSRSYQPIRFPDSIPGAFFPDQALIG
ncbi:hypothetical protein Spico_1439 [Parasphaerochaeta coccoides DSM 17374]|uniref:Uncharacterized protein n=1 Tax=Parasphaerochaeta coccoides (strain ATCC BAA-1237 / DSM 17374 / SPN1) TaxID=760011 RepID=F4GI45_PARC1|nr:hypothetical protein Spico_1439 [Parasphaerochaeta coccoides DSM 17374]